MTLNNHSLIYKYNSNKQMTDKQRKVTIVVSSWISNSRGCWWDRAIYILDSICSQI